MGFLFEDLEVYKKSIAFVVNIHAILKTLIDKEIKDQLKRAALSIPLNIAEGNGRIHKREKKQYFYVARGSLLECVSILQISFELKMISREEYGTLYEKANEIGKMLNGLIRSIEPERQQ